jgi:hypothetical protein
MTAKKYQFSPDTVRVKRGDHVKLVIAALDREHGIKINASRLIRSCPKAKQ